MVPPRQLAGPPPDSEETPYTDKRGQPFVIREARGDDAAAFIEYMRRLLEDNTYYHSEPDEWVQTVDQERDLFDASRRASHKALFLAVRNGKIIGSIDCRSDPRRRVRHVAEIGMGVARGAWNRGIGTALLNHAEQWARDTGTIQLLTLWVFASNTRARALYDKMGYREAGRKPRAVLLPSGYDDEMFMVKPLQ